MSRYGRALLGLTVAFVLFTGGWFLSGRFSGRPYQVTTQRQDLVSDQSAARSEPEEARPDSLMEGETIDINTADVYELQRLPGIGEKRAQSIVDYREEHGPFRTVDELDNVSGIGQGILDGLRDYASVGQETG